MPDPYGYMRPLNSAGCESVTSSEDEVEVLHPKLKKWTKCSLIKVAPTSVCCRSSSTAFSRESKVVDYLSMEAPEFKPRAPEFKPRAPEFKPQAPEFKPQSKFSVEAPIFQPRPRATFSAEATEFVPAVVGRGEETCIIPQSQWREDTSTFPSLPFCPIPDPFLPFHASNPHYMSQYSSLNTFLKPSSVSLPSSFLASYLDQFHHQQELPIPSNTTHLEVPIPYTTTHQELPIPSTTTHQELPIPNLAARQEDPPIPSSAAHQELPIPYLTAHQEELPIPSCKAHHELPIPNLTAHKELPTPNLTAHREELSIPYTTTRQELPISSSTTAHGDLPIPSRTAHRELPIPLPTACQELPILSSTIRPSLPPTNSRPRPQVISPQSRRTQPLRVTRSKNGFCENDKISTSFNIVNIEDRTDSVIVKKCTNEDGKSAHVKVKTPTKTTPTKIKDSPDSINVKKSKSEDEKRTPIKVKKTNAKHVYTPTKIKIKDAPDSINDKYSSVKVKRTPTKLVQTPTKTDRENGRQAMGPFFRDFRDIEEGRKYKESRESLIKTKPLVVMKLPIDKLPPKKSLPSPRKLMDRKELEGRAAKNVSSVGRGKQIRADSAQTVRPATGAVAKLRVQSNWGAENFEQKKIVRMKPLRPPPGFSSPLYSSPTSASFSSTSISEKLGQSSDSLGSSWATEVEEARTWPSLKLTAALDSSLLTMGQNTPITPPDPSTSPYEDGCCKANDDVFFPTVRSPLPSYSINSAELPPGCVWDSHCHLDFLARRLSTSKVSSVKFGDRLEVSLKIDGESLGDKFGGCVANFCDPRDWSQGRHGQDVSPILRSCREQNRVFITIGCHPHFADRLLGGSKLLQLERLAKRMKGRVVAIGECGLDNSRKNDVSMEIQKRAFSAQVMLALKLKLPLVLHIRDAEEEGIKLLRDLNIPKNWRIHRHCFTGSWSEASAWLKLFPGSKLGLTGIVTFPHAAREHEVARRVPLDRLLLETDAPYFLPTGVARKTSYAYSFSQPGHVVHVAAQVAALRKISLLEVLRANMRNIKEVYGINT